MNNEILLQEKLDLAVKQRDSLRNEYIRLQKENNKLNIRVRTYVDLLKYLHSFIRDRRAQKLCQDAINKYELEND